MKRYVLAGLLLATATVLSSQRPVGPRADFKPGLFKMLELGEGGSVPAEGTVVKVVFDKTHGRYSHIEQQPLAFRATVTAACGDMSLKEMSIAALNKTIPAGTAGLTQVGSVFTGTKTFKTNDLTTAALVAVVPDPVATCSGDLDALVKQGKHSQVQNGWARRYENVLRAELTLVCEGKATKDRMGFRQPPPAAWPTSSALFPVWIHCAPAIIATPAPRPPLPRGRPAPRTTKAGFQAAKVFVNPPANANYRGRCPKVIAFGGEVEYVHASGAKPMELRYRYRTHDGGESPIMTTTLSKTGTKNISYWKREFGGLGEPGGLATPATPAGKRVVDGWVRLEILGHGGAVVTYNRADFRLTCEPRRVSEFPAD